MADSKREVNLTVNLDKYDMVNPPNGEALAIAKKAIASLMTDDQRPPEKVTAGGYHWGVMQYSPEFANYVCTGQEGM